MAENHERDFSFVTRRHYPNSKYTGFQTNEAKELKSCKKDMNSAPLYMSDDFDEGFYSQPRLERGG